MPADEISTEPESGHKPDVQQQDGLLTLQVKVICVSCFLLVGLEGKSIFQVNSCMAAGASDVLICFIKRYLKEQLQAKSCTGQMT